MPNTKQSHAIKNIERTGYKYLNKYNICFFT